MIVRGDVRERFVSGMMLVTEKLVEEDGLGGIDLTDVRLREVG